MFDKLIMRHFKAFFGQKDGSADPIKIYSILGGIFYIHITYIEIIRYKQPLDWIAFATGFGIIITAMCTSFGIRAYVKTKFGVDAHATDGDGNGNQS